MGGVWRLEFRLLGPVEAWDDDGRRLDLGPRQQRFVLAVLLLEANRVVPVARLVELLWPDEPPPSARHAIQVRVSALRGLLGESVPVVGDSAGYRIQVDPEAVDVHRFRARVSAARAAADGGDDDGAVRLFRAALHLWTGQPLAGAVPEEVRDQLGHSLEEAHLVTVEDCLDAELRLGRHANVLDELTGLVRAHPTRERLVGQLMLALHRGGQTARALETARATRDHLADELGIDPGTALQDLELAILRDDPALAPPARPAPVEAADAAADRAPEPAARRSRALVVPAQLPPAVAGFTGRDAQLAHLDQLLATAQDPPEQSRLVVLSGMGGLGKTTLALRWAHGVADRFPDGQLYLDLHGHAAAPAIRPVEALAHLLRGLGIQPDAVPTDLDGATAAYRTALAGRRVLVVLDNAGSADQVRPLLPGEPACLTLVTSRDLLTGLIAKDGARRLPLDSLDQDEAIELLETLLGPARAASEADAVAALADLCARLPLALRIAAGYLTDDSHRTVAAYVDELRSGDLLDALTIDGDDDAAIRATFDLSYQRLDDPERRLFRLLGLVPGPDFSADAAAALSATAPAETRRQLRRLTSTHLLTQHAPGRYRLHDLLRQYAEATAHADESTDARGEAFDRLMAWHYHSARAADLHLAPTMLRLPPPPLPPGLPDIAEITDDQAALDWFRREHANARAAISAAATNGPPRWAWLLAEIERHHLHIAGRRPEQHAVVEDAIVAAEKSGDSMALASAYLGYGNIVKNTDIPQAVKELETAVRHAEATGDPARLGAALNDLGIAHLSAGALGEAQGFLVRALEAKARASHPRNDASTLTNLATVAYQAGDLRMAVTTFGRALAGYDQVRAPRKRALVLTMLAEVTYELGDPRRCLPLLDEADGLARAVGNRRTLLDSANLRIIVYLDLGRLPEARAQADSALRAAEDLNDLPFMAATLAACGLVDHRSGDHAAARRRYHEALAMYAHVGSRLHRIGVLIRLADLDRADGRHESARSRACEALALADACGARGGHANASTVLANLEREAGRTPDAVRHAERALAIHRRTGHHLGTARALVALATALRADQGAGQSADQGADQGAGLGDDVEERAEAALREAHELFTYFGSPEARSVERLRA